MFRLPRLAAKPSALSPARHVRPRLPSRNLATAGVVLRRQDTSLQLSSPSLPVPLSLPYAWLRDSCQCPRCIHPSTKQKLARTGDFISSTPRSVTVREEGVHVSWAGPEGEHDSLYSLDFLARYAEPSGQTRHTSHFDDVLARVPWDLSSLPHPKVIPYHEFMKDPLEGFIQVLRHGILLLRGVPYEWTEPGMHAPSAVEGLAEVFGIVRDTMYGRLWDVVSKKGSTNIAFTNLNLDLHMDLM